MPERMDPSLYAVVTAVIFSVLFTVNIITGDIRTVPQITTSFERVLATVVYAAGFISVLRSGAPLEPAAFLTGLTVILFIPALIMLVVFRKNVIQVLFRLFIYALLVLAISWVVSLINVDIPRVDSGGALRELVAIINLPFAWVFYIMFMLLGYPVYVLPYAIMLVIFVQRGASGHMEQRVVRFLLLVLLELVLVNFTIAVFVPGFAGGYLSRFLVQQFSPVVGQILFVSLLVICTGALVLHLIGASSRSGEST